MILWYSFHLYFTSHGEFIKRIIVIIIIIIIIIIIAIIIIFFLGGGRGRGAKHPCFCYKDLQSATLAYLNNEPVFTNYYYWKVPVYF